MLYLRRMRYLLLTTSLLIAAIVSFAGTITCSTTSLYNFGNVYPYHSSTIQRYTVSGSSLTADLVLTADNGFEVSLDYLHGYGKSITIVPSSGSIRQSP